MSDFFFSTDALCVGYDKKPLISDITIGLERGEILTLIGPNGSGKSTILKTITRHLSKLAGTVLVEDKNLHQLSGKEMATRLAVVLTDRIKPEMMTCGELVASGRYPYTGSFGILTAHDRAVVMESLARVHAEELYDRDFSAVSDGQRQRILLARAICQEPEIIVLDEPTSFLDIRHKIELLAILRDMAKNRGITIVMSLHEIDLAYKVSDKILCVKGDKIAAFGTPEELFTDDRITSLYEIENGAYDSLLGSIELAKPCGMPAAFAVGGGGYGAPFFRAMQKLGIAFDTGILFQNDIDCRIARPLASKVIETAAFEPIGDAAIAEARSCIEQARFVVDCGCTTGGLNLPNRELVRYAETLGKPIYTTVDELRSAVK